MPERDVVSVLPSLHPSTLEPRRDTAVRRPLGQPPSAAGPAENERRHLTVFRVSSEDLGRGAEQILHSIVAPSMFFRPLGLKIA